MGVIQRAMVKACPHVWFERSEVKDRHLVAKRCDSCSYRRTLEAGKGLGAAVWVARTAPVIIGDSLLFRLTEHVQDKSKLPILIFPEGELRS